MSILSMFLPRETSFFGFFQQQAALTVRGAKEFLTLVSDNSDLPTQLDIIRLIEQDTDVVTNSCIEGLHRTFLTPIDRDDIFRLVSRMDDVMDFILAASERIVLYKLSAMTEEVKKIAVVLVDITQELEKALGNLNNLKNAVTIKNSCIRVKHLENDADDILHKAIGRLFDEEPDTRLVIKWKEVYEKLEWAIGRSEDVAGIIEGVILEYM